MASCCKSYNINFSTFSFRADVKKNLALVLSCDLLSTLKLKANQVASLMTVNVLNAANGLVA